MTEPELISFTHVKDAQGKVALRPLLNITLSSKTHSIDAVGLLDTGSDINVLPYSYGLALGALWDQYDPLDPLSGNLGSYEARGIVLSATVRDFAPVRLVFAWSRAENAPLILGQVNFFQEFDVCFFRSEGLFNIQIKQSHQTQ
jgi:hypothetical protein